MEKFKFFFIRHKQIILYMVFGTSTFLINMIIYSIFVELLHIGMTFSSAVAWLVGVLFSFVTNKLFVFESHRNHLSSVIKEATSFFMSRAISGVIEVFAPTIIYSLGVTFSVLGIKGLGAKLITNAVVIVMNYVFARWVVFSKRKKR